MATNMVQVAEDGIWTFTVKASEIEDLLRDPQKFITGKLPKENITFQYRSGPDAPGTVPITIVFHYGVPYTDLFQVQGIKRTNIVTVRGPRIEELNKIHDNIATLENQVEALSRQIPDPRIQSKRLLEPKLAFSHFKPGDVVEEGYAVIAKFITNPSLLVAWLNRQKPDPEPKVVRPNNSETSDKMVLRYALPSPENLFRYHYQTFVDPIQIDAVKAERSLRFATTPDDGSDDDTGDDDDDQPDVEQCSKPSGPYTEEGNSVVMTIDQVVQTLWIPEPAPTPPQDPDPGPMPPQEPM